jgi:hypothetical protein
MVDGRSRAAAIATAAGAALSTLHGKSVFAAGTRSGHTATGANLRSIAFCPFHQPDPATDRPHQHWRDKGARVYQQCLWLRPRDNWRGTHRATREGRSDAGYKAMADAIDLSLFKQ